MQNKITPNIWFNGNAKEAVEFYLAAFPDGKIVRTGYYPNSAAEGLADFQAPLAGKELVIEFELAGTRLAAINAGPEFQVNPAISFTLSFDPGQEGKARLDELWGKLIEGGQALMPLQAYPFSPHYGWVRDRYGVTWQLNLNGQARARLIPSLLFTGSQNRAEAAIRHYVSLFPDSQVGKLMHNPDGGLMYGDFQLAGHWFSAMDGGSMHVFDFSEGVSLSVACRDQAEIDSFWEKLSKVPEAAQCGWCKDEFGVSWQVTAENMLELMKRPQAFARLMPMKKLILADF